MSEKLLEVKDLHVMYRTDDDNVYALNGVDIAVEKGKTLGLVGETGAGKTTLALSIMRLLPDRVGFITKGGITLEGRDLLSLTEADMRTLRGSDISMIFQDPMTSLNPIHTVGDQIAEVIALHNQQASKAEVERKVDEMLEMVGIPAIRKSEYPHQFSGGMKQRIVIAIALACQPDLLIADEPTTALDVTIQAQVLEMMKDLQKEHDTATLMITHDLGIVAEMCDKCAIIYAGEIVEYGTLEHIFDHPMHPYTIGLMESIPSLDRDVERLKPIPGLVADPTNLPNYCSFYERCEHKCENCRKGDPQMLEVEPGHFVKCFLAKKEG